MISDEKQRTQWGKGFGGGYVGKCNEPFGGIGMMVMDITHYNVLLLMHQLSIM